MCIDRGEAARARLLSSGSSRPRVARHSMVGEPGVDPHRGPPFGIAPAPVELPGQPALPSDLNIKP